MTDNDIAATLQGTWSVVQYCPEDGETKTTGKKEIWTFSGNLVYIYVTSTFTVSNGIMYADAVDGAIILTKLTSTEFEGYWNEYPGEKYYGVKQ